MSHFAAYNVRFSLAVLVNVAAVLAVKYFAFLANELQQLSFLEIANYPSPAQQYDLKCI